MRYFAKIRYDGAGFQGFQVQKIGRTVQGELNRATEALFGCPCAITGCSRTDSGVHAEEFCLTIEPENKEHPAVPPKALPRAILPYLPRDLSLTYATVAPDGFHARYDADGKEYWYRMRFGGVPDPFLAGRVWQLPHPLSDVGFARMQEAAACFVGYHDFTAFMCTDSTMENCCRTVRAASVVREGDNVVFRVEADGFLYNMVRIMTGTLYEVGKGRRTVDSILRAMEACDRTLAGMTAPPDGLYLHHVVYPAHLEKILFDA